MRANPSISVVVPSYRRAAVLRRCLSALHSQSIPPIEILVCRRSSDLETADMLEALSPDERRLVREVVVGPADNFGRSLHAGIQASEGELVALTDDDAEAPADWLKGLASHFGDEDVAGVGGRDVIASAGAAQADRVGVVQWHGRRIGNHHLGCGPGRPVDVLKGVNCCFRGSLLRDIGVNPHLRGEGMVMHTEVSFCLAARTRGHRLIYDPAIVVAHHTAPRVCGDANSRGQFSYAPFVDAVHNHTLSILLYLPMRRRVVFRIWGFWIGTREEPGLFQLPRLRFLLSERSSAIWERYKATREGRKLGIQTWLELRTESARR